MLVDVPRALPSLLSKVLMLETALLVLLKALPARLFVLPASKAPYLVRESL